MNGSQLDRISYGRSSAKSVIGLGTGLLHVRDRKYAVTVVSKAIITKIVTAQPNVVYVVEATNQQMKKFVHFGLNKR